MDASTRATAVGLLAPVLWGMSVGICRGIAEDFGRGPGFTVMYAAACLLLLLIFGRPHLRAFSLKYLLLGVGAANVCAICFIFSLSMAEDATQTMQVGMVNYLWPCLTIVFAVLFNGERARWWIVPGAESRLHAETGHGRDARQGFAAEPEGADVPEIVHAGYFAGGVARDGQLQLGGGDARAVVPDPDEALPAVFQRDLDQRCSGVEAVFHKFFDYACGAFHDFTGCDLIAQFG